MWAAQFLKKMNCTPRSNKKKTLYLISDRPDPYRKPLHPVNVCSLEAAWIFVVRAKNWFWYFQAWSTQLCKCTIYKHLLVPNMNVVRDLMQNWSSVYELRTFCFHLNFTFHPRVRFFCYAQHFIYWWLSMCAWFFLRSKPIVRSHPLRQVQRVDSHFGW